MRALGLFCFLLFSSGVFAQCPEDFERINFGCAPQMEGKLGKANLKLSQLKIGDIFFFETAQGRRGKFRIRSVKKFDKKAKGEDRYCSVYLEIDHFSRVPSTPSDTLHIADSAGKWPVGLLNLDSLSPPHDDLILSKGNSIVGEIWSEGSLPSQLSSSDPGPCYFSTYNAKIAKYGNIAYNPPVEGSQILYYFSFLLIGLSAFLIAIVIFSDEEKFKASEKMEDQEGVEDEDKKEDYGIVLKYSKPIFKRYFTPIVQGMKSKKAIKEKYRKPLANAGLTKVITPEDFFAFKLSMIITAPILYLGLRAFLETDWPISGTPLVALGGFFYPNIWVNGRAEQRRTEVLMSMPFIVDMLALSVEAGLDFVAAMTRVIEKAPASALTDEFETLLKEIKLGQSRGEALRQLSWRVDVLQVSSFCATLIAADSVGASIGPILKNLSQDLRQKRSAEIEKKGAQAATKILFPMMIFILPAVFLMIGAPIALQLITGDG